MLIITKTKTLIIINQGTSGQVALRINKHNAKDFTNQKNFNHETENKATHVGSTALTLIVFLTGESIKSLPAPFKISLVYQLYKLYINVINESFQGLLCHINKWTHQ